MVHRRLMAEGKEGQAEKALSIQECVFDEMWNDTSNRIRAAGINELSVCTCEHAYIHKHHLSPYTHLTYALYTIHFHSLTRVYI